MEKTDRGRTAKLWRIYWAQFDETLEDLGQAQGQLWDPWALAVFVDVPAYALAELLPEARKAGLTEGFDLVGKVRDGIRKAMKRLWDELVEEADDPLRLEWGLTGLLLAWEWLGMKDAGEEACDFFERVRELRLRMPEVALCERTVHQFCLRVPPPRIRSGKESRGP